MRHPLIHLILLVIVLVAIGSPATAEDLKIIRDLAYLEPRNERNLLDIYAPSSGKGHPIVLWIHGGGWQVGNKSDVQVKPEFFVRRGYVFVSTNYRLLPNATIKEMGGDIAKALRWVVDHAEQFGVDPESVIVGGHSAGAQLAALLCTDHRYLIKEGLSPSILKGCLPVDGDTYDVELQIKTVEVKRAEIYKQKFGDEENRKDLSSVTHATGKKPIPPFAIFHVADHPETKLQSERLVGLLKAAGYKAQTVPAVGKNHGSINADLGKTGDPTTDALIEFLASNKKKND